MKEVLKKMYVMTYKNKVILDSINNSRKYCIMLFEKEMQQTWKELKSDEIVCKKVKITFEEIK